jgi:hypothetical protein
MGSMSRINCYIRTSMPVLRLLQVTKQHWLGHPSHYIQLTWTYNDTTADYIQDTSTYWYEIHIEYIRIISWSLMLWKLTYNLNLHFWIFLATPILVVSLALWLALLSVGPSTRTQISTRPGNVTFDIEDVDIRVVCSFDFDVQVMHLRYRISISTWKAFDSDIEDLIIRYRRSPTFGIELEGQYLERPEGHRFRGFIPSISNKHRDNSISYVDIVYDIEGHTDSDVQVRGSPRKVTGMSYISGSIS